MAELQRVQTIRKFEIAVSKLDQLYITAKGAVTYTVHSLSLMIQSGFSLCKIRNMKYVTVLV